MCPAFYQQTFAPLKHCQVLWEARKCPHTYSTEIIYQKHNGPIYNSHTSHIHFHLLQMLEKNSICCQRYLAESQPSQHLTTFGHFTELYVGYTRPYYIFKILIILLNINLNKFYCDGHVGRTQLDTLCTVLFKHKLPHCYLLTF